VPVSAARAANPNTAALGLGWHLPPLLIPALGAATLGGLLIWSLTRKSP